MGGGNKKRPTGSPSPPRAFFNDVEEGGTIQYARQPGAMSTPLPSFRGAALLRLSQTLN